MVQFSTGECNVRLTINFKRGRAVAARKLKRVGTGDPRYQIQPRLPGSVVGEESMPLGLKSNNITIRQCTFWNQAMYLSNTVRQFFCYVSVRVGGFEVIYSRLLVNE